jgi:hypothetical protein
METERKPLGAGEAAGLRRTVAALVVLALAFYLGFIFLGTHQ